MGHGGWLLGLSAKRVIAVLALVVLETNLIDLLANAADDLSANGSACNDAHDTAYDDAKHGASRACHKP